MYNLKQYAPWIIWGLVGVALVVLLTLWFTRPTPTPTPTPAPAVSFPTASNQGQGTTQLGTGPSVYIATGPDTSIETKDFLKDSATVSDPVNHGHYYLGYHEDEGVPDATVTSDPPYIIEYIASTQFFAIALRKEPLRESRAQVEQYLMAHLGISQDQMCQLQYQLGVPARVSPQYAGTDLRFSFCPGAAVLP